ncbi:MAG: AAA family ATPase [Clostridia bacterium]|nr:AAA family ATPase [Clostridia bacterium]
MKLYKLTLENFQGIRSLELAFDGHSAAIYGDNATGKTTVFNAMTWLLFDKASTGAKDFTPKTRTADGEAHNLNHTATAELELDGGRIVLSKTYKEIYKKKKGSPVAEFTGHTTDYFVNGVPVKKAEYTAAIDGICDAEKMKVLTIPHYFSEGLSWQERRELLIEICGEVPEEEIIAATPELAELPELLRIPGSDEAYGIDEFRKIASARKTKINKELAEIPSRIDEVSRSMSEIEGVTAEDKHVEIEEIKKEIDRLTEQKAELYRSGRDTELEKRIAELRDRQNEIVKSYERSVRDWTEERAARLNAAKLAAAEADGDAAGIAIELKSKRAELDDLKTARARLIDEYNRIRAETFDEGATVCPTCGREYPPERITELRERFNMDRSKRLEDINEQGKKHAGKERIAELGAEIELIMKKLDDAEAKKEEAHSRLEAIYGEQHGFTHYLQDAEYKDAVKETERLEAQRGTGDTISKKAISDIDEMLSGLRKQLSAAQSVMVRLADTEKAKERIAELERKEAELAAEYEETERAVYLCEEFIRAKVAQITERINDKFKTVRFRLFEEQLNGGVKEDCSVMVPADDGRLVPYAYANNAARINAGLEIIATLAGYWGVSVPIFIDNAESVTHLIDTGVQTIRLIVSEADKQLRLEVAEDVRKKEA